MLPPRGTCVVWRPVDDAAERTGPKAAEHTRPQLAAEPESVEATPAPDREVHMPIAPVAPSPLPSRPVATAEHGSLVYFTLVVRGFGTVEPDYAVTMAAPMLPSIGSYVSIQRPDRARPYGEDLLVQEVWWRCVHEETRRDGPTAATGQVETIFVECDPALGPYSSDNWRLKCEAARTRGIAVHEMRIGRAGGLRAEALLPATPLHW